MSSLKQIQEERTERFQILVVSIVSLGIFLLLAQLYYANYDLMLRLHCNSDLLDRHFFSKNGMQEFFGNFYRSRLAVLCCLGFMLVYFSRGDKPTSFWRHIAILGGAIVVFLTCNLCWFLPTVVGQVFHIFFSLVACGFIISYGGRMARYIVTSNASIDENERLADGFEQMTTLIETPVSINWKYEFSHLGEKKIGYINEISPFRASFVLGMPGTGKTYSFLDTAMKQLIAKHFAAVVYDYKDPTLSNAVYQYYINYIRTNPQSNLKFGYLSFVNINYTQRCNPLKGIATAAEAIDFSTAILVALNKNFVEKQGEFFTESAKSFTAIVIYALGLMEMGRYLSLPHTIAMLSRIPSVLFPALKLLSIFYPDMQSLFSPFKEAYDNNVLPQLQGQISSAQIGLGTMSDASLAYVMTEDEDDADLTLDLNNVSSKDSPMLLCIGSNPKIDKILGLANSVYLTRLANLLNRKGRKPTAFFVDELPTVYINGLDQLISTARSNKVAAYLGFQDFSQINRDYGQKIADATINTVNNVFVGAVKGQTAKSFAESFGKKTVKKISKSINEDGKVSTTISEQKEERISQQVIEELSQGWFVGRIADEADNNIKCKVFHGKVLVETTEEEKALRKELEQQAQENCAQNNVVYNPDETPIAPLLRDWSPEEIQRRLRLNLIRINNEVSDVLLKLNMLAHIHSVLVKITNNDGEFGLHRFLENPDDHASRLPLLIWLEEAYRLIIEMDKLNLKGDILTFEEKFNLLLRDVYTTSYDGLQLILEARERYNAKDLTSVQNIIKTEYAGTF